MTNTLLGIDLGTSALKAGVFNLDGSLLAVQRVSLVTSNPHTGWFEQDPLEWRNALLTGLQDLAQTLDFTTIRAVGFAGQCPGHVLLDESGLPLGSAIIWRDQRAGEQANWLKNNITPQQAQDWTGSPNLADASQPPARLLWLQENRPHDWRVARWVVQPKDYLVMLLTGNAFTDRHSAYSLANPETGMYNPQYFTALNLPIEKMPPTLWPSEIAGHLTPSAARLTGLPEGIPVICGTIDAWCDNLAGGIFLPGRAVDVCGTSEMISLSASQADPQVCGVFHAQLDREGWFVCGPTQSGGDTLRWLASGFYPELQDAPDYTILEKGASQVAPGCEDLVFLPYLSGERAPIWDAHARGILYGLSLAHNRFHVTRAVYEGVAYSVRQVLETCERAAGQQADLVAICGGGSNSRFWNQLKADILQRPVAATATPHSASLGAAILAAVGAGLAHNLVEACKRMVHLQEPLQPNPSLAGTYARTYVTYQAIYPAFKAVQEPMSSIDKTGGDAR